MNSQPRQVLLVIMRGESRGREFTLEPGDNLVGRWDPDTGAFPEIDLEAEDQEAKVSRKHAIVRMEGNSIIVSDIGSLNGTYINRGKRLVEGEKHELKDGDELVIGKTFLKVEVR